MGEDQVRIDPTIGTLSRLAQGWYGVFLLDTATKMGWERYQLHRLADRQVIEFLSSRAARFVSAPRTYAHRVVAASASLGPDAAATFRTAAGIHRLDGWTRDPEPIQVHVPRALRNRKVDFDDVEIHSSNRLRPCDVTSVRDIPVTSVEWTLARLGHITTVGRVEESLDGSERDKRSERDAVASTLLAIRGRGVSGVSALDVVLRQREAIGRTPRDLLLRRFARVLVAGGLPKPELEYPVLRPDGKMAYLDGAYPWAYFGLEVDGQASHSTRAQRRSDALRQNMLLLSDFTIMRFTYEQAIDEPAAVVAQVAAGLARSAARIRPFSSRPGA